MTAYFVAATGTGVGKTFTTCALLHAAQEKAIAAHGFKPIISGWDIGDAQSDTRQIIAASRSRHAVEEVSPWRFAAPLSPHRAAAQEARMLDTKALVEWTHAAARYDSLTWIETVGGVMVPLTNAFTTLDWMAEAKLPVVLVVGSYLGTISHTLTALEVLWARDLRVVALVMNETDGSAVTLSEAMQGLEPFIADIGLRIIQPRVSSWREARAIHGLMERL